MVTVSFPGLGIGEISFDKVAFTIPIGEGIEVRWYGIIIVCGIILAFLYAYYRSKQEGIVFDDLLDYAIFTVVCGVIGARLYYVITKGGYSFGEIFRIWEGGLAIYGGIIGGALALLGVSLYKKIKWQKAFDMVSLGVMIGQFVGRWGNFFNGEAFGAYPTVSPEKSPLWFMRMELFNEGWNSSLIVQPTFLYESVWNIIGFIIIHLCYKKKKFDGQIFLMYITWYGFGRMLIEGLRTDSLMLGDKIRVSQLLGFLCFVAGTALLVYFSLRARRVAAQGADGGESTYSTILNAVLSEEKEESADNAEEETEKENDDVSNTD